MSLLLLGAGPGVDGGGSPPATIGDPVYVAHSSGAATGNQRDVTIPAGGVPAGKLLLPAIVTRSTATVTGVTDSAGNTYSLASFKSHGTGGRLWLATCHNALALAEAGYVRFALNEATYCVAVLDYIGDAHPSAALDVESGPEVITTQNGGPFTQSLGPFASSADEMIINYMSCYDARSFVTTPPTGFTALTPATPGTADEYAIHRHYKRQQSTTAVTLNASYTSAATTQQVGESGRAFKGA